MKIALFSDSYWPVIDGVVTAIDNFSRELAAQGHDVAIFAPKPSRMFGFEPKRGVENVWVESVHLPTYKDYRVAMPIAPHAKHRFIEFHPDIVHVQTPFSLGWMGLRWAEQRKIPCVAHYHTLLPNFLMYLPIPGLRKTEAAKSLTWKYTRAFYNRANLTLTPTQPMADELLKQKIRNVRALSNGVDFERFNRFKQSHAPNAEFRLVFIGRLSFEKNINVLIDALPLVRAQIPQTELWLVGDGPAKPSLQEQAQKLGLSDHVIFTGARRGDDLAKTVGTCHIMVTASTMETQGLSILEAMAAGLPAVGADYLGIPEAIDEGKNGYLFKPFDANDLAQKIVRLYARKKDWTAIQDAAFARAQNESVSERAKELAEIYAEVKKTFKPKK